MTGDTRGGLRDSDDLTGTSTAQPSAEAIEQVVALTPLMARLDVVVAAVFALIAATLTVAMPQLIASGGLDTERDFSTLSPALIPRLAFGLLTVLAVAALISAIQTVKSGVGRPRADQLTRLQRAGIAAGIAIAYAATVTWLGYTLSTMLMTAAMAYFLGLRNPLAFIPGVIIVPVVIRFVFERLLLISLPRSSIESIGGVEDAVMRFLTHVFIP